MKIRIRIEAFDEGDSLHNRIVVETEVTAKRGLMMATKWEDIYTEMIKKAIKVLRELCDPS